MHTHYNTWYYMFVKNQVDDGPQKKLKEAGAILIFHRNIPSKDGMTTHTTAGMCQIKLVHDGPRNTKKQKNEAR